MTASTPAPAPADPLPDESSSPGEPSRGAAAAWLAQLEGSGHVAPGRGVLACVEVQDQGRGANGPGRAMVSAVTQRLRLTFGDGAGVRAVEPARWLLVLDHEDTWTALAANVVEAAVGAGVAPDELAIGVGLASREGRSEPLDAVLRRAVRAATDASEGGIGCVRRSALDDEREARAEAVDRAVRGALAGELDGLRVIFQPRVDAHTERIVGAEALLRLHEEGLGDVSALEVLEAAEARGELQRLDRWVLGLGIECLGSFRAAGRRQVPVSVNVRGETLRGPGFTDFLLGALRTFGVEPEALEIEVAADEVHRDPAGFTAPLRALRRLGVGVALDGFGTASTTRLDLGRLPVTSLKLDRRVVGALQADATRRRTAQGSIHLARALSLGTTAVGIETPLQADLLREAGCASFQGFLFHRPVESAALLELLGPSASRRAAA